MVEIPHNEELDQVRSTTVYRFLLNCTYAVLLVFILLFFLLLEPRVFGKAFEFLAPGLQFMLLFWAIPQMVVQSILLRDVIWLIERSNAKERDAQPDKTVKLRTTKVYTLKNIVVVIVCMFITAVVMLNVLM